MEKCWFQIESEESKTLAENCYKSINKIIYDV